MKCLWEMQGSESYEGFKQCFVENLEMRQNWVCKRGGSGEGPQLAFLLNLACLADVSLSLPF